MAELIALASIIGALLVALIVVHFRQSNPSSRLYVAKSAPEISVERGELSMLRDRWKPPAALLAARAPRDVELTAYGKGGVRNMWLSLGLGVLISLLFAPNVIQENQEQKTLEREAVRAQAQVLKKSWKSKSYFVDYRFRVGGRRYTGRASVSRADWEAVKRGVRLPVRYAASDPDISQLDMDLGPTPMGVLIIPLVICAIFAATGFTSRWSSPYPSILQFVRQRGLLRSGQPAPAIVTRVSGEKTRTVRYRFLGMDGDPIKGKLGNYRHPIELRDVVTVLYDPRRPRRNTLYPSPLFRLPKEWLQS